MIVQFWSLLPWNNDSCVFKLNINVSFCSVEVSFHDFEIQAPHHKVAAGKSDPRTQQQISQKLQITPSMGINFMLLWYPKPREIHMVSIKAAWKFFKVIELSLWSISYKCLVGDSMI